MKQAVGVGLVMMGALLVGAGALLSARSTPRPAGVAVAGERASVWDAVKEFLALLRKLAEGGPGSKIMVAGLLLIAAGLFLLTRA